MTAGESPLIQALRQAVLAAPDRAEFRTALAEALLEAGDTASAIVELGEALRIDPVSGQARDLMLTALGAKNAANAGNGTRAGNTANIGNQQAAPRATSEVHPGSATGSGPEAAEPDPAGSGTARADTEPGTEPGTYDWLAAEKQLEDIAPPPRFAVAADSADDDPGDSPAHDVERPTVTLADVGGLADVKDRLEIAFLAPLRNPELRRLYGKSLRGGLLLYGPPGCGKTFVARAVAGELGAAFVSVGISEVLDMWIGTSERNLHELFELARRKAPCVLFFDEVDALGQRRSQLRNNAMRTTVNQFLAELDSVDAENDGVFVLGATNIPWDVDPALRRPGRFDRTVLVLPPDDAARTEILDYHVRERPIAGIDLPALAARTGGFSGADLAHLCETAAEYALLDSVRSGTVRMIGMPDFERALTEVKPSTGPWFDAARSVALFANEGGAYDDLADFFKKNRML
jgi:AAA+ superfamily predicted ATPase